MTMSIKAAAGAVASAKAVAEQTAARLAEAQGDRGAVAERIAALEAERAGIVAARKAGLTSDADGGRLALLGADLENLGEMLSEADAAIVAARAEAQKAAGHVTAAERSLASEADGEKLRRLLEHASRLDGLLLTTIRDIADTWRSLGRSPGRESWVPSPALADAIKRIDLTRENRR